MMFIILITCLLGISKTIAQTPDSLYTPLQTLPVKAIYFTTDQIQQVYLVTEENEIIKYSPGGKELFRFNNNTLGTLGYIDAKDPFQLLCFYPEFLTVIILDRTLNQIGEYNLYDLDIINVEAVGLSNDNNIWVYDDVSFKLKKINREGEVLVESGDMNLLLGIAIQPKKILEKKNLIFVNVPEEGILQFDNFGAYIKTIPIKTPADFQVLEDQLIYREEEKLFSFNLKSLLTQQISLPNGVLQDDLIRVQKDRLYIQQEGDISLYQF